MLLGTFHPQYSNCAFLDLITGASCATAVKARSGGILNSGSSYCLVLNAPMYTPARCKTPARSDVPPRGLPMTTYVRLVFISGLASGSLPSGELGDAAALRANSPQQCL